MTMTFGFNRTQLRSMRVSDGDSEQENASKAAQKRILRVAGAMFVSNGLTIVLQLLMVPTLIWAWGASLYGEWIILYTIPGYLSLTDFGIIATASNRIEAHCTRKLYISANRTYLNSVIVLLALISLVLAICTVFWLGFSDNFVTLFTTLERADVRNIAALLFADAMVTLILNQHSALYRTLGKFNWTVNWQAIGRVVPIAGLCVAAAVGATLEIVALTMLLLRVLFLAGMALDLVKRIGWTQRNWMRINRREIMILTRGALGFMSLPLSNMIYLHVTTLAVAAASSPSMVATFATMRTFTRMIPQFVAIAGRSRWSEISRANARGDHQAIESMRKSVLKQTLILSGAAATGYLIFGKPFYLFWTDGKLAFDSILLGAFLANGIMIACYYSLEVFLLATSRVEGYAKIFFAATLIQIAAGYLLVEKFGVSAFPITGAFASLCVFGYLWAKVSDTKKRTTVT